MKLRRTFLAVVVLAGFLVLLLGVTGVFSPKKQEPVVSGLASESAATIHDFSIESDTWRLHADEARPMEGVLVAQVHADSPAAKAGLRNGDIITKIAGHAVKTAEQLRNVVASMSPGDKVSVEIVRDGKAQTMEAVLGKRTAAATVEGPGVAVEGMGVAAQDLKEGGYVLIKPSLEVKQAGASGGQAGAGGEERLTVQASEGATQSETGKRVRMSGGVRIEFAGASGGQAGAEKIVLTTPSAEVDPEQATGRTADEVEMVVESKEGRQHLWGKGAEFVSKQRLIVVSENIRMELTGAGSGIFPLAPATAGKPASKPGPAGEAVTKIECRGPATADGFNRTVELKGEVHVHQGEDHLRADRVEVQFAEGGRTPERFVADGAVTFKASGAEGACDRLAHSAAEDQLLLEGKPARVRRGASEIEATRIELSGRNVIEAPVAGSLKLVGEEAAGRAAEALDVKWSRRFRLDPNDHQAWFWGDVHFARGDQTIECQTLTVKLDSENRQILECTASGDVRMAARMQGGGPAPTVTAESVNAQAKELEYDPQKDFAVLSGGAVLQQGPRTIRGERIEIHPKEAGIAVTGAGALEGRAQKDSEGFSISWEREMQFSRAKQDADFQGGVGLNYGGHTLHADRLTARLVENALKGFDASGHVTIREEVQAEHLTRTLTADRVVSAVDEKTKLQGYEATGHVTLREDAGPAAAGKPATSPAGQAAGVRTMRADRMTAKVDAENRLETFEATGRPVTVEEEGRVAYGDRLTWDAPRDSGTLFGSPAELRLGPSRLFGDRVEFAPKRGAITVISNRRVEATVVGGIPGTAIPLP
jgi:lipopolysaccharide transport protein LptA